MRSPDMNSKYRANMSNNERNHAADDRYYKLIDDVFYMNPFI